MTVFNVKKIDKMIKKEFPKCIVAVLPTEIIWGVKDSVVSIGRNYGSPVSIISSTDRKVVKTYKDLAKEIHNL